MNTLKLVGVLLVVLGILGAAYGGFSYTKETHAANIGPLHLEVVEKERVNIPLFRCTGADVAKDRTPV